MERTPDQQGERPVESRTTALGSSPDSSDVLPHGLETPANRPSPRRRRAINYGGGLVIEDIERWEQNYERSYCKGMSATADPHEPS